MADVVTPVVQRLDYTVWLEQHTGNTWGHIEVRRWSARVAEAIRRDFAAVMALHGGPIFTTTHEPHGGDMVKWRKFVSRFGFEFHQNANVDGVEHPVFVRWS